MPDLTVLDNGISIPLIGLCFAAPLALFVCHVLMSRHGGESLRERSPQVLLVRLVLALDLLALAGAGLIAWHEDRGVSATIYMLIFVFLVFNGVAYAYFHFFNMSETARRIRMLLQVRAAGPGGLPVRDLERAYSQRDMIEARLDRLVKMRQLTLEQDGRYRVAGHVLLWAGSVMSWWRRLVWRRASGMPE